MGGGGGGGAPLFSSLLRSSGERKIPDCSELITCQSRTSYAILIGQNYVFGHLKHRQSYVGNNIGDKNNPKTA